MYYISWVTYPNIAGINTYYNQNLEHSNIIDRH